MAATGLEGFDGGVHTSNEWIDALASRLGSGDRRYAYRVLRAYLQALRDRLTLDEAAKLAAHLPHPLRGVFYEGWDPGKTPETYQDRETFLARLADSAQLPGPTDAAWAAQAATEVLRERLTGGRYHLAELRTDYADTATEVLRERVTGRGLEEVLQIPPDLVRTLLQPAERA